MVQETLLDEGLRVVKEYTSGTSGGNSNGSDDCINLSTNGHHANNSNSSCNSTDEQMSPKVERISSSSLCVSGGVSTSLLHSHHTHQHHTNLSHSSSSHVHSMDIDGQAASHLTSSDNLMNTSNSSSSTSPSSSTTTNTNHLLNSSNVNTSVLFSNGHILPPAPPPVIPSHRPRGRPPKAIAGLRNLEAAYHEKLTQHLQQSFLATQAYNQVMQAAAVAAVANTFSTTGGNSTGNSNGHSHVSSSSASSSASNAINSLITSNNLPASTTGTCNGDTIINDTNDTRNCKLENEPESDQKHHLLKLRSNDQLDLSSNFQQKQQQLLQNHLNHHSSSTVRTNGFNGQSLQSSKDTSSETDLLAADFSSSRPITSSPILSLKGDNNGSHFTDH